MVAGVFHSSVMTQGRSEGGDGDASENLSLDDVFELLAHRHRRRVLYQLEAAPGTMLGFEELVNGIVDHEAEETADPAEVRRRVSIGLDHSHLPKLAAAGILERDEERRRVEYDPDPLLGKYLSAAADDESLD